MTGHFSLGSFQVPRGPCCDDQKDFREEKNSPKKERKENHFVLSKS